MIAIIDYKAGNTNSVQNALGRLGAESIVTADAELIRTADKVIFPGVGHAHAAMQYLREQELDNLIVSLQQPVLGICLGLQLLCRHSEEGDTQCLSVFDVDIKRFQPGELKVPHVGWNNLAQESGILFEGIEEGAYLYYVHGFYAEISGSTTAVTNYILPFSAALQQNNFYAVQFHLEKSGRAGEQILNNFLNIP